MKKFLPVVLLLLCTVVSFAQNNPRPSRSRFWNSKLSTFTIKPGDILVYSVNANGKPEEYIITVTTYGSTIHYNYSATGNTKGNVSLDPNTISRGAVYATNFSGNNKPTFWLSKTNYKDIETDKRTRMDVGNGIETFVRSNNSTMKINYKGKTKIITLYNIVNEGAGNKKIGILNDANNPLLVNMSNGFTITLKEVR